MVVDHRDSEPKPTEKCAHHTQHERLATAACSATAVMVGYACGSTLLVIDSSVSGLIRIFRAENFS